MTREEEILNKAIDYSEIEDNFIEYDDCGDVCDDRELIEKAFIEGAKWADKTMIDNAIKWIKENIDLVAMDTVNARSGYHQIVMMDDFERKFRESMEK
jgi:hypothetical protein